MAPSEAPIEVVAHDPAWPLAFERAAGEAATALGPSLSSIDRRSAAMERLGYEVKGEFGIAGRRYFRRDDPPGRRTHQLHAFAEGAPEVRRHLAFRDFLRAHPTFADEYSELKQRLAEADPYDMPAYMNGKAGFISRASAARASRSSKSARTGPAPPDGWSAPSPA